MATADRAAVNTYVTPDYFNHRSADEPMEARQRGPEGPKATIRWLHRAFTDMRFEFHEVVVDRDHVVARVTCMAANMDRLSSTIRPTET
ncbi:ester cyclase [Haladaptatus pallidirubidus]|uniref:SnoaL-like domain-containing protein n=1 Tax=Haladaptatus pallidirubidus TaxID=1008152 RepID=A0AAV3UIP4_9EURY|nr:ester cyclase [Haladaptatus pallidirubidus]